MTQYLRDPPIPSSETEKILPRHLQEINLDITDVVKPVSTWLYANEHLWCPAQQPGLDKIPAEKVDINIIVAFWGKVKDELLRNEVGKCTTRIAESR